ncbi:hypothetical protein [Chryseobacterium sp. R2A-55]|uniref:hypothetical protein n=1 Tax=Chryseobacterium sp. R2A-55 TaxID=2744445 RepID=UPI001F2F1C41|nr:hypothetical protein [Chryseobacterium sp. R2A-55]
MDEVHLTKNIFKENTGINLLQKPMKIYLENTNLMYLLAENEVSKGNIRESFFANQVGYQNRLNYISNTDFLVNGKYAFEIGGKNKSAKQLLGKLNSFVIKDDIEIGRDQNHSVMVIGFPVLKNEWSKKSYF